MSCISYQQRPITRDVTKPDDEWVQREYTGVLTFMCGCGLVMTGPAERVDEASKPCRDRFDAFVREQAEGVPDER
jgi:hypothetical protein